MLSRSRYSGDGHALNSMSDMQLGSWGGGVRIFGRGVRKKGGSDEPPEPPTPGYGPVYDAWRDWFHIETHNGWL